ncbi:MAG: hypothetical protein PHQ23_13900, partial [Candidatus Wallbacteria bacterium]|nr:hypothetical protein [Candidatus Wallbacteria bacterium]
MKCFIGLVFVAAMLICAESNIVPPHGYMSDTHNIRGLVVPESHYPSHNLSPTHAIQNSYLRCAGTDICSSLTLAQLSDIHNFSSLKALINTSLWTLHLSKTLTDDSAKDAAEQVYAASLDENERQSAAIAKAIVDQILEGNRGLVVPKSSGPSYNLSPSYAFDQFENTFNHSTNNEKNGLGILAGKIEELLLQSNIRVQRSSYLPRIRRIIAQSQNAQISFSEW